MNVNKRISKDIIIEVVSARVEGDQLNKLAAAIGARETIRIYEETYKDLIELVEFLPQHKIEIGRERENYVVYIDYHEKPAKWGIGTDFLETLVEAMNTFKRENTLKL